MFGRGGPVPNLKLQPSFSRGEPKVVDSPRRYSRPNSARSSSLGQPDNGNVLTGAPPAGGEPQSTPRGRRTGSQAPSEEIQPRIGRRPLEEPRHEPAPYGKRTFADRRGADSVESDRPGSRGKAHVSGCGGGGGEWFSEVPSGGYSAPRPAIYHPSRGCKNRESDLVANRELPTPSKRVLKAGTPSLVGVLQPVPQQVPKKSYRPTAPFYTADD